MTTNVGRNLPSPGQRSACSLPGVNKRREHVYTQFFMVEAMKKSPAVMMVLLLVLSGCLGFGEAEEETVEENANAGVDTDGDGLLDIYDSDDDDDQWRDIDELNCMSDPLDATDVPVDTDGDYVCDVQDADDDGDGFDDADELQCQTDPLDETSTPSDMDNDGLCDPLDDDVDGDGVDNENDSSPENPQRWGSGGCVDESAYNFDERADHEDGTCFTLSVAETAVIEGMQHGFHLDDHVLDQYLRVTVIYDESRGLSSFKFESFHYGTEEFEHATTYLRDGNGFVQVEHVSVEYDNYGEPTGNLVEASYLVDDIYHQPPDMLADVWSHCELEDTIWYCATIYENDYTHELSLNKNSENMRLRNFVCDDGSIVKLSDVNDGTKDCPDGEDEPVYLSTISYECLDGTTVPLRLVNDGNGDCPDGTDEPNFITAIVCDNDLTTVPSYRVNDGTPDCDDGSDEPAYDLDDLSSFTCDDGTVVGISNVNNGVLDCEDGTDEQPSHVIGIPLFDEFGCDGEDGDEEEIELILVNDGKVDCPDGDDEPQYDENGQETSDFGCWDMEEGEEESMENIPLSKVNDGVIDCDFRQDEAALSGNETVHWYGADNTEDACTLYGQSASIPWSWVNDGIADCDDASDEPSYDITGAEVSQMSCLDGRQIALSLANDGKDDCSQGEDETIWDTQAIFTCDDGQTVPWYTVNDGYPDCEGDRSDEPVYDLEELSRFTCDDGQVVFLTDVNDGEVDCSGGEDEPTYEMREYSTFECSNGDVIFLSKVNDGSPDCANSEDEPSYDPITQSEISTYECWTGDTIPLSTVNDGDDDCQYGEDEPHIEEEETSTFTCDDGRRTIELSDVNDWVNHCQDGSDEPVYDMGDDVSRFVCTDGSIITVTQYNDGTIDCQDGSDETSMYECQASWGSDQIPLFYVNDGYANCADGLDEDSTPDSSEIDCQTEDGQRIAASSFFDGTDDCNNGWDEMEFHVASNCNWQDGAGWSCDALYMNPVATWTFHEETNDNGLAVYVLSSLEKSVETRSVFDAETHAFLTMSVIEKDRSGATVGVMNLTTQIANPSIFEGLSVNNNLPVHAPPFAVLARDDQDGHDEDGHGDHDDDHGSGDDHGDHDDGHGSEDDHGGHSTHARSGATNGPHGHGTYMFSIVGPDNVKETHLWTMGTGPDTLEVVFVYCGQYTTQTTHIQHLTYHLPTDCGAELARYTLAEIMAGDVLGLEITDQNGNGVFDAWEDTLDVDQMFSLNGWNTIRLSTPDGAYADENPAVVLPAVGLNMTLLTMLGAALLARRRFE